ncbi:hypothetical protein [Fusobacterium sp. IOR10]|uniref:hypothetical protein n=1 Tax=Fusobacterium sp. IOR10 TaxID=2665157 RepID=UPI0013D4CDD2|nr:hypothetical protein [Fusobacterium sp. IOR10]
MNIFKFYLFYAFLFLSFSINSFSEKINITFNFNVPNGYIYYDEKIEPILFKNNTASLKIEKGNYTFVFSDINNNLIKKNIPIFKSKEYKIRFLEKDIKKIKGKILSEDFKPISNCKIEITNRKKTQIITSDSFGNFQMVPLKGINLIKISKPDYCSKIAIRNFKSSSSSNVFILSKQNYSILGTIINDVFPIKNIPIYLFSQNGSLLKKTQTDIDGNFSITNIASKNCYIFIPETKKFKSYKSKFFNMDIYKKKICVNLENN